MKLVFTLYQDGSIKIQNVDVDNDVNQFWILNPFSEAFEVDSEYRNDALKCRIVEDETYYDPLEEECHKCGSTTIECLGSPYDCRAVPNRGWDANDPRRGIPITDPIKEGEEVIAGLKRMTTPGNEYGRVVIALRALALISALEKRVDDVIAMDIKRSQK